jgi:dihydropteroate synthase
MPAAPPATWAGLTLDRPRVMGILNVTQDSFSDGGQHPDPQSAIAAGLAMTSAGADIIDVGGESTRPGAQPISPEQEQQRVVPVIRALAEAGVTVSVDTRNAATMAAALDAGAAIVNDISGLAHDPAAAPLIAARRCPVVVMHMRGTPATMNAHAVYADLAREVIEELADRLRLAAQAGIVHDAIAIDPGIGFAKLAPHSLEMLRRLPELAMLGRPILVGVSRKSFIGCVAEEPDPRKRLPGSLTTGLFAISRGAHILRVHDVAETVQALRLWHALRAPHESNASLATDGRATSRRVEGFAAEIG